MHFTNVNIYFLVIISLTISAKATQWMSPTFTVDFANYHRHYRLVAPIDAARCRRKNLFIFVLSAISSYERRMLVRKTWAHEKHMKHASVWFVTGRAENANDTALLTEEHKTYGDLLWIDIGDGYNDTGIKVYAGYQAYSAYCGNATHVLRVDDDVVVLPDRLMHLVWTGYLGFEKKAAYGILWEGDSKVVRDPT
uniref:Hexosyltransferase n=1 Tax=Steinernema glaseri TaxID=37863 RepID=A0A1I7Z311_9BILA